MSNKNNSTNDNSLISSLAPVQKKFKPSINSKENQNHSDDSSSDEIFKLRQQISKLNDRS